jgi:hypothetical protein
MVSAMNKEASHWKKEVCITDQNAFGQKSNVKEEKKSLCGRK